MVAPEEYRKSLCVFAGWLTLLECLVHGGASAYAVGVFDCAWAFAGLSKGVSVWSMLYVTYLMGGCSGQQGATDLGYYFSPPAYSAINAHVWLWIDIIFCICWLPTCVLLIVAASKEIRGRNGALLYYPWLSVMTLVILLDISGAVYHFVDIFQTNTADAYAGFIASTSWSTLTFQASTDGVIPWLPSLIMSLYFSRLIFFWLLNIYILVEVFRASTAVCSYNTKPLQASSDTSKRADLYARPGPRYDEQPVHTGNDFQMTELRENSRGVLQQHDQAQGMPARQDKALNGRPGSPDSFSERVHEAPPPRARPRIPPELAGRTRPFSYIAGDQPHLTGPSLSRSNSGAQHRESPHIPRPDYTIEDRRTASLEYIPNRFKVPTPRRPVLSQSSLDRSPSLQKQKVQPSVPLRNPLVYPQTLADAVEASSHSRYVTQQAHLAQPISSQYSNYNINKLY